MSEWISVEEAATKYGIEKEYIQLWADMQVIMSYFKDYRTVVNDQSLRGFLKIREKGISPEYVKVLEQLCISKSEVCSAYAFLLGARDKELKMYREAKSQRDALRGMWIELNERTRDLEIELELGRSGCYKCPLKKAVYRDQKNKTELGYKDAEMSNICLLYDRKKVRLGSSIIF
ncbi:hypothetical protein [Bacteroides ovatus]|uniref:hypothetical protein n=1 Tax=Bacteroides ovatus TaxID=28116 RepID=UPI001E599862|nr:hypothetical protein [Bacteroides ovatus]MDC2622639.1 hypothetical protein [Bacteroides ovatus]MDC2636399.1 hypothetical protein [Bacteroides ovatus]MDC2650401.1 hypothetical protein [Bacteroides ovatus]